MKLGVFSVIAPELEPEAFVRICREAGILGIDWRYKDVPPEMANEEASYWRNNHCYIPQHKDESCWDYFKNLVEKNGMVSTGVMNYAKAPDIKNTEEAMAAARYLGAKMVRLSQPAYDSSMSFNELYELFFNYLEACEPLCRKYGVKGVIETHHGGIPASVSCTMQFVRPFDPDYIGILFDPGNMVREGFEDYKLCAEMMGPYLAHVHVKNAAWQKTGVRDDGTFIWESDWVMLEQGMADWKQIIAALKSVSYEGYLVLEDFSTGRSFEEKVKFFVKYIGSML